MAEASRPGVVLGIDVGSVRIGVARTDPDRLLATPLTTVRAREAGGNPMTELAALVQQHQAVLVVVGLPRGLSGDQGRAAATANKFADQLRETLQRVPVVLCDERFSTVTASRNLAERGIATKQARGVIDQAAATVILQHWLDSGAASAPPSQADADAGPASQAGRVRAKPRTGRAGRKGGASR